MLSSRMSWCSKIRCNTNKTRNIRIFTSESFSTIFTACAWERHLNQTFAQGDPVVPLSFSRVAFFHFLALA